MRTCNQQKTPSVPRDAAKTKGSLRAQEESNYKHLLTNLNATVPEQNAITNWMMYPRLWRLVPVSKARCVLQHCNAKCGEWEVLCRHMEQRKGR